MTAADDDRVVAVGHVLLRRARRAGARRTAMQGAWDRCSLAGRRSVRASRQSSAAVASRRCRGSGILRRSQRGGSLERRHRVPPPDRAAQPEDAVARVVGLLRRQRLRRLPRHRVQRDPRAGRAHRRQPALQVRGPRPRRRAGSSTGSSPATRPSSRTAPSTTRPWCDEDGKVVDDGTIHRLADGSLPLDRRRPAVPLAHDERDRARRRDRGRQRDRRGRRPPGPVEPGGPRGGDRRVVRRPALLPAPGVDDRAARPSTSAGPATPATSATSCGSRPTGPSTCGTR